MKKKELKFTEEEFLSIVGENNDEFKLIEVSVEAFDFEKRFAYVKAIIKYNDEYYESHYSRGTSGNVFADDPELVQVFPKQKTITVYE
jgi:hypothetical protein